MSKIVLDDIQTGYGSTVKINQNFQTVQDEFDNTLSRDGTAPNSMLANLDMNSKRVLNLPAATTNTEPVTYAQFLAAQGDLLYTGEIDASAVQLVIDAGVTETNVQDFLLDVYNITAGEVNAGVVPLDYSYLPGDARRYGATGDGVTDDTDALDDWIAAMIQPDINGVEVIKRAYLPAGTYIYTGNMVLPKPGAAYTGGYEIHGDGYQNSKIQFTALSGDALSIQCDHFSINGISFEGTAARLAAGSGRGIFIDAQDGTTSYGGEIRRCRVLKHGGHGIEAVRVEHHNFDNTLVSNVGGTGFYLNHGAGQASWNTFINCRAQYCGGPGFELTSSCINNTLVHPEALACTGPSLFIINGRSNTLISPDAENPSLVTGATSFVGIELRGSMHQVISAQIYGVNTGIAVYSTGTKIEQPLITNGVLGVTGTNAIYVDASAQKNIYYLPTGVTAFTNVISPATGSTNDILIQGSTFGVTSTWTPSLLFGGAATGMTYSSQIGTYTKIGNIVFFSFDITLSAKGSSTGSVTISGLPHTAASTGRWMTHVAAIAASTGVTNLDASAVQPSSTSINIRIQSGTAFSEASEALFNNTTRITGAGTYQIA